MILEDIVLSFITNLEGGLGSRLRYAFYSRRLRHSSGYFKSLSGFRIHKPENVSIGSGCSFNHGVIIDADDGIDIGNNVLIGQYSILRDVNHKYSDDEKPICKQGWNAGRIFIRNDVWVGCHAVILKDSVIGTHCVVAAHSLVNKVLFSYGVYGGVPVKFLRKTNKGE